MSDVVRKRRAFFKGHRAETLAAWMLRLKGYRILKRRYKKPVGEIDLVAKKGPVIIFVEVKARRTEETAIHSITAPQQRRITRAAQLFLQENPKFAAFDNRFDVVLVTPWHWPRQIKSAW